MKANGRPRAGRWRPSQWAGFMPNGLGQVKPNHYWEMLRTAWRNRKEPGFTWRILRDGVCDGCALGTTGLHDFTMDGVHLCTVRLNLLELNTMPALDWGLLAAAERVRGLSSAELRRLGRLPYPMVRRKGDAGFRRVAWEEVLRLLGERLRRADPNRVAFYVTSRGMLNESYYSLQKSVRALGTNNVDNSSRICHSPSTTAMKKTMGLAASTCSYSDWIGTDLLVFFGSDVPNNQPVTTKYLFYAKKAGTKILVINPYQEPGLERYWVPSVFESAVFGTKLADRFFAIHTGGDIAFITGVAKRLLAMGKLDAAWIEAHAEGLDAWQQRIEATPWQEILDASGATREDIDAFAELYAEAKTAVFVWSMGITQHRFGVDNVAAICDLALLRGMVGREKCGLMPIRGHSGVQGGAEMGCVPNALPGGVPLSPEARAKFAESWGFPVPEQAGFFAVDAIDAAHRGELDVLWSIGGNWLETLPEPDYVRAALERVPVRIHQDIVLTPQMLLEPNDLVVLLPATTRYEMPGGGTETSTERRVYFSPEIRGRRIGEARAEWEVLAEVVGRARPELARAVRFRNTQEIRDEIARLVPDYHGIADLKKKGDAMQWGGPLLAPGGVFPLPGRRARFADVAIPRAGPPEGQFLLSTRRGKQFNSMVQAERDPLNGARREDVLMSRVDAEALGLRDGDPVRLTSDAGWFVGRVKTAPIRSRNVQVHWPEGNVLVRRGLTDPACGIPDYNALVRIEPAAPAEPGSAGPVVEARA